MKTPLLATVAFVTVTSFVEAQVKAILYTGRFPFVSLAAAFERPGGAISQLSEFDFSYSVPVPGGLGALPLATAANLQCYLGDGDGDGSYLKFDGWKGYFENIGIDGVFVKFADTANASFETIYWTPRLDGVKTMEVLDNNGTPVVISEGDWVRVMPSGETDFFLTRAQLEVAVGFQAGLNNIGAGALVQSATGDLYYAPADDGHWVNGNQGGGVFAEDGAILKIDAANITYDAQGNVAALAPDSARLLINEVSGGPGGSMNVRSMVLNAGTFDRFGASIVTTGVYAKTGGLALDPNGGTWMPVFPDAAGVYTPEPNLIWCSNAGSYAGTMWTTNNQGEVAVINGVECGSTTLGVPADGSWLGVELNTSNFQPTLLGMTLIDLPTQPLIADVNGFGRVEDDVTQPDLTFDFYGTSGQIVLGLVDIGLFAPSPTVTSFPTALIPLGFSPSTWPDLFTVVGPVSIGFGVTDPFGFTSLTVPNINTGAFAGVTLTVQGIAFAADGFKLSTPLVLQLQ